MVTYTIASIDTTTGPLYCGWEWITNTGNVVLASGDTVTVVADLDFTGTSTTVLELNDAVFDGGKDNGYTITIGTATHGILETIGGYIHKVTINTSNTYATNQAILINFNSGQYGNINDIVIDGIAGSYPTISDYGAGITCRLYGTSGTISVISECDVTLEDLTAGIDSSSNAGIIGNSNDNMIINNCKVKINGASISSSNYAGIVAGGIKTYLYVDACWTNIPIENTQSGGILYDNDSTCDVEIASCISTGDITTGTTNGGLVAQLNVYDGKTYSIHDSYYTGNISDGATYNVGGILGFNNRVTGTNQTRIRFCYASGTKIGLTQGGMIYGYGEPEDLFLSQCLIKSGQEFGSSGLSGGGFDYPDSPNPDIGNLKTLDENTGEIWDLLIWTAGTGTGDSLYPTLDAFAASPWLSASYVNYNDEPEFGAVSGGGGDPHIVPVFGLPYELPTTDKTYLLFNNCQSDNLFTIKAKCGVRGGLSFFKYIRIETRLRDYIIDMDDLRFKKYTNDEDFYENNIPSTKKQFNRNRAKRNYIWKGDKVLKTLAMDILIPEFKAVISLYSRKNSISIKIPSKHMARAIGALVRNDIREVKFDGDYIPRDVVLL